MPLNARDKKQGTKADRKMFAVAPICKKWGAARDWIGERVFVHRATPAAGGTMD